MRRRRLVVAVLVPVALLPLLASGDSPVDAARALLAAYHEDPARIDRARELLEAAAQRDPSPGTLVELARAWFLTGEMRATTDDARLAAYERGRETARRAIAGASHSERAHLYYAANEGRWVELKGVLRALFALPRLREAADTILALNPASVDGLVLAGSLDAEVPAFLGGDKARAERRFLRALEVDPHHPGARLQLARLYVSLGRRADARHELRRLLDDRAPSDRAYWTVRTVPRARALLQSLGEDR
ncbi:MAG: tetratricopeptide repeat protein [Candidatus Rokuibacteriota bacterium]